MKKILITGGSGFIGRNLIQSLLLANQYEIYSVSRSSSIDGVKNIQEDLITSDFSFLSKINPDYVVYLGTVSSPKLAEKDPQGCYDSNVTAIEKFLEKCREVGDIKKIVLFSSIIVYKTSLTSIEDKDITDSLVREEDPIHPTNNIYTLAKYFLEQLGEYYRTHYQLPITVYRLSNSYGPFADFEKNPTLIAQLFYQAIHNKKMEVWNERPVRDWIYVGDVVEVIKRELETQDSGLFNLATGKGASVGEIAKSIQQLTGAEINVLNKKVSPPFKIVCDVTKLKKHLGFTPVTTLEKGLEQTFQFYAKEK